MNAPAWTAEYAGPIDAEYRDAAARALACFISDVSEDEHFAGWLMGIEFDAWAATDSGEPKHEWTAPRIATLRALSALAGGWVRWNDDHSGNDSNAVDLRDGEPGGVVFVPWCDWEGA